jgi:hypothetical protein
MKQGLTDPSASNQNENEVKEQKLKELDLLLAKQKELEDCRAKVKDKSLRQKIEEVEALLLHQKMNKFTMLTRKLY